MSETSDRASATAAGVIVATVTADSSDTGRARWRMLALLAVAELLGMSLWFAGNAISGALAKQWGLSGAQAGWLTASVQLGFVSGTAVAAILNLADVVPAARYFAASATLGAMMNAG